MIQVDAWLPIGSVVHIEGDDGLTAVTGYMQQDVSSGRLWDYVGIAYPQGWQGPGQDVMFDRESIDGVSYLGAQDADSIRMMDMLVATEPRYYEAKLEVFEQIGLPSDEVAARLAAARERLARKAAGGLDPICPDVAGQAPTPDSAAPASDAAAPVPDSATPAIASSRSSEDSAARSVGVA